MFPSEVFINLDEFIDVDFNDSCEINEAVTDYLSDNYDYCVLTYGGWETDEDKNVIRVFDIEWDVDFECYLDELSELDLDDTAYDYYRNIIEDMHYNDIISAKNGLSGYESYEDVLNDARRCCK